MSPRNRQLDHDRALDLMVVRNADISEQDSEFLRIHLSDCLPCSERSATIHAAISAMRSESVYADPTMVRATQMRVRQRAAELQAQRENMRPLWVSSALALGWAVLSMPLLWQGFAWLGHTTHLPDLVWQTGFGLMALTPIAAVSAVGLASRLHHRTTS